MLQAGPSTSPMAVAPTTPKPDRCRNEIIDDEVRPAEFEEWETQTERLKHHLEHQMNTAIADKKLWFLRASLFALKHVPNELPQLQQRGASSILRLILNKLN